jgi:choline dehydrogenase-like flavoprotein
MGLDWIGAGINTSPPPNLVAGGCRFGTDPRHSVLDPDCRVWGATNLFVSDASFMPTGGSVPYTWTIYANAFRVADKIRQQLG